MHLARDRLGQLNGIGQWLKYHEPSGVGSVHSELCHESSGIGSMHIMCLVHGQLVRSCECGISLAVKYTYVQ